MTASVYDDEAQDSYLCLSCLQLDLSLDKFRISPKEPPPVKPARASISATSGSLYGPDHDSDSSSRLRKSPFAPLDEVRSRKDDCRLCSILWQAIVRHAPSTPPMDTVLHISWEVDGRLRSRNGQLSNISRRIRVSWEQQPTGSDNSLEQCIFLICIAPSDADASEARFLGRARIGDAAKLALMTSWISTCLDTHCKPGGDCDNDQTQRETDIEFRQLVEGSYFGVIDVREMQLKPLPSSNGRPSRYVALSYVWGRAGAYTSIRANVMKHIQKRGLASAWPKLPRTIQDAILLVWRLGERYLWIDSLCIVQDSRSSWELNARAMHLVYGHAHFTICAADGDASSGLRAVSQFLASGPKPIGLSGLTEGLSTTPGTPSRSTPAMEQALVTKEVRFAIEPADQDGGSLTAQCLPGVELLVTKPPEAVIQASEWNSRGWTFQERLLSKRCLIFADAKVYFQCRTSVMSQDVHGNESFVRSRQSKTRRSRREKTKDGIYDKSERRGTKSNKDKDSVFYDSGWSLDLADSPLRTLVELRRRAFWFYMKCVPQYTGRVLSKPKDVLAAFQGTSWLLGQHLRSPLLYGLPASHFDLALLWTPVSDLKRRKPKSQHSAPCLGPCSQDEMGNCTCKLEQEGFGSEEFPSWSWAGWMGGKADYRPDMIEGCTLNVQEWLRNHTWILWYMRDEEGNLMPLWDKLISTEDASQEVRWKGYQGIRPPPGYSHGAKWAPEWPVLPPGLDHGYPISSFSQSRASDRVGAAYYGGSFSHGFSRPAPIRRITNRAYLDRLIPGYYEGGDDDDEGVVDGTMRSEVRRDPEVVPPPRSTVPERISTSAQVDPRIRKRKISRRKHLFGGSRETPERDENETSEEDSEPSSIQGSSDSGSRQSSVDVDYNYPVTSKRRRDRSSARAVSFPRPPAPSDEDSQIDIQIHHTRRPRVPPPARVVIQERRGAMINEVYSDSGEMETNSRRKRTRLDGFVNIEEKRHRERSRSSPDSEIMRPMRPMRQVSYVQVRPLSPSRRPRAYTVNSRPASPNQHYRRVRSPPRPPSPSLSYRRHRPSSPHYLPPPTVPIPPPPPTDPYGRPLRPNARTGTDFMGILPDHPFGVGVGPFIPGGISRPMPVLQFWTWLTTLTVYVRNDKGAGDDTCDAESTTSSFSRRGSARTRVNESVNGDEGDTENCDDPPEPADNTNGSTAGTPAAVPAERRCDIYDDAGDWCGAIMLPGAWIASREGTEQIFIAVSDAKSLTVDECPVWNYYVPRERSESEWDLYFVMLLERTADRSRWERRGLGKVFKPAFGTSTWSEIKLG